MTEDDRGHLGMTRKIGESVFLGEDIEIRIAGVVDDRVSLVVIAPKGVRISRSEPPRTTDPAA